MEASEWDEPDFGELTDDPVTRRRIPPSWRIVGIVAALSMLAIPLWNVLGGAAPQVAANGLEVCRFDYCAVERALEDAGLALTMAANAAEIVPDSEVQFHVDAMIAEVGGPAVRAEVVDQLPGDLGGRYSPVSKLIQIDRPATLWVIAHEVAHTVSAGHDGDFRETLIDLARYLERVSG